MLRVEVSLCLDWASPQLLFTKEAVIFRAEGGCKVA
jgi:hypothetical protein